MRKLVLLLFISGLCFWAGCAANPITGEDELMFDRDYHHDVNLGKEVAPQVEKELKGRIPDQQLQDYINGIGHKITRFSHNPDFDFNFVAVNDKSINALALPGGHIYITKGLLAKLENESQLAGILAHETVHVVARDTENMMSKQVGMGVLFVLAATQARIPGRDGRRRYRIAACGAQIQQGRRKDSGPRRYGLYVQGRLQPQRYGRNDADTPEGGRKQALRFLFNSPLARKPHRLSQGEGTNALSGRHSGDKNGGGRLPAERPGQVKKSA